MSKTIYIFAEIEVNDLKDYINRYGMPFMPILKKYKGELISGTSEAAYLEGNPLGNWVVLAKFPNKKWAMKFMNSTEYAPLRVLRINELTTNNRLIMFPENSED